MNKTRIAVASLLLFLSVALSAADLPPGRWWRRPEVVKQLSITDEQQGQLDAIFRAAANTLIDSKGDVEKLNIAIRGELDRPVLNRANLLRLATELSAARGRLFERELMMLVDMRAVLNDQQWTTLQGHLDRMRDQRQKPQRR